MSKRKQQPKQQSERQPDDRLHTPTTKVQDSAIHAVALSHLRFGWSSLLCFLCLGLFLETLHGFKVDWYVDDLSTVRRHLWTLAHAHGTLLAVLNLVFGASVSLVPFWPHRSRAIASTCLFAAGILLPAGFFLGGAFFYSGDPGFGILLVPIGAVLLILAVLLAVITLFKSGR